VLVTGASGLLGRAVVAAIAASGRYEVVGTVFSRVPAAAARVAFERLDLRSEGDAAALVHR